MSYNLFRISIFSFLITFNFSFILNAQLPQLRSVDCNRVNTSLSLNLYANLTGASQYKFKVTNIELGVTDSVTKLVRSFYLNEIPTVSRYSCNYEVSICMDNGAGFGAYGNVCNPSSIALITKLRTPDCGKHLPYLYTTVYAAQTTADSWDFQIRKAGNPTFVEDIFGLASRAFNLSMASIAFQQFNQEYEIRVRTTQGSIIQPWGDWCSIYTPAIIAQLRNVDCGRHIPITVNPFTYPLFANIPYATSWDFQIRSAQNQNYIEDIFGLPTRKFQLIMASNLFQLYNREYQIRVRTNQGGVLQPWGPWCSVFTPFPAIRPPDFPDMVSVSSAGGTLFNNSNDPFLYILNNVGETITETFYGGNPQTPNILTQGFEQPSRWYVDDKEEEKPVDMPTDDDDYLKDLNSNLDISLYPNPYSDNLMVNLIGGQGFLRLNIIGSNGRIVKEISITQNTQTLQLKDLESGTYIFDFRNQKDEFVKRIKVIKSY